MRPIAKNSVLGLELYLGHVIDQVWGFIYVSATGY